MFRLRLSIMKMLKPLATVCRGLHKLEGRAKGEWPPSPAPRAPDHRYIDLQTARNDRILNCGQASDQPLWVRFQYRCPNRWETLSPTEEAGCRYCGDCRRNVYFCDSAEAVKRHARHGDCIAVPCSVTAAVEEKLTRNMMGRPDVYQLWSFEVFSGHDP